MNGILLSLCLAAASLQTGDGHEIRPDTIHPAVGVKDPVFAYLVGLVDADLYGSVDATTLESFLQTHATKTQLPYEHLDHLRRLMGQPHRTADITASFQAPLSIPVPYRILGYAPGRLRASREVRFREWILGELLISHKEDGKTQEVRLSDVHLFALQEGIIWVDVAGWLDHLVGGKLDDTRITGLVLFVWQGERWGLAVGYNRDWKGRSGLLSMRENEIRFPSPPPIKTAAWKLRQILEGLEPSARPDSLKLSDLRRPQAQSSAPSVDKRPGAPGAPGLD